jgi:hypothetical protein
MSVLQFSQFSPEDWRTALGSRVVSQFSPPLGGELTTDCPAGLI